MMLWFEALPSALCADGQRLRRDLERLEPVAHAGVERLLVPEVLDGEHSTVDNVAFAAAASDATGLPAGAAICVAPRDHAALDARAVQADAAGIDRLLLVGATHRRQTLAGPDVHEALGRLQGRDLGVVTIPARRRWRFDEPHRLLRKQRAGASFGVSQILYDAEDALRLRRAYLDALAPSERPLPVLYSLAPVRNVRDLDFMHLLGVHVPHDLGRRLRDAPPHSRQRIAQDAALRVAGRLAQAHEEKGLGPYGFCISHVMVGNVEAATELAAAVHDRLHETITV